MKQVKYNTLSEATNSLAKQGYENEIRIKSEKEAVINKESYAPSQLKIDEVHRFEGMTNPSDSSICYAISSKDGKKGLIVDAYGAESSIEVDTFIKHVKIDE
tara:strand:+ start:1359 stop:1664 length:306 start_codon:yes stop_codon:yes gene_type:complete